MFDGKDVLGLNARNRLYLAYNKRYGRRVADSKLLTKRKLAKAGLPTPKVIKVFRTANDVFSFDWTKLQDNFVLKPCSGFGGGGIIIVKKKAKWAGEWRLMDDSIVAVEDLRLRALDILAGQFSLHNLPDQAFIEERIKIRKLFQNYAYHGTPDIRVIVFSKVPVAAMLRLPTPESGGKANLHQGAIGVGIDLATGITTAGVIKGKFIKEIPWTGRKINGLKLPFWDKILTLAVQAQMTIPQLGFVGVDIILDKDRGPMILEINARPGLEIQNANLTPLKKRLERVEGLEVVSAQHGVKIAKALFAGRYADRIMAEEGIKTISIWEDIKVCSLEKKRIETRAKIDTGAWRTSLDRDLAKKLGLMKKSNILWSKVFKSSLGNEKRPIISLTYYLKGRRIDTAASVANRSNLKNKVIIGRRDLNGYIIKPGESS